MNAYEQRRLRRQVNNKKLYAERRSIKLLNRDNAEKFYTDAFRQLNGQDPLVIPKVSTDELVQSAQIMLARLHELEMGGCDEG